ncbi:MAG: response regulator [Solirubrobacteraceae bacterium]
MHDDAPTVPDDAAVQSDGAAGLPPRRLLYVEDNLSNLTLVEWILDREADVELISAMLGVVGLHMAREHRPGLIVLDLHLPDISGEQVLRGLKADDVTRDIPVVILTADANDKRAERLLRLGAVDYMTKPLDIGRFLEMIGAHLPATAGA